MRVLVWAGAPVPAFHPTRSEVQEAVRTLTRSTRIRCEIDPREHPFHCHHEKTISSTASWPSSTASTSPTTPATASTRASTGPGGAWAGTTSAPACAAPRWPTCTITSRGRWYEVTGERLERPGPPAPAGDSTVQVVRTVAENMYDDFPRGDFRILESYMRALRSAQRLIYLENQFLWSPEIVAILADKLRNPPRHDFRLVVLLPAKANNGQDDTRGQLSVLAEADDHAGRFLAATIRSRTGEREDPLYVHAKVGIVDDRWLTVGSANLNAHSLLNDTEMNVVTDDAALARATRVRLWAEHLELEPDGDRRRRPGVGRRRALAAHRRRPARAPRARGAAHPSPDRAARRLEALAPASSARWRASRTTADARFARSLRTFRGARAAVPSAPSLRSAAAFGRHPRRVPAAQTAGNGGPTGPSGPGANRRLKAGVAHVSQREPVS